MKRTAPSKRRKTKTTRRKTPARPSWWFRLSTSVGTLVFRAVAIVVLGTVALGGLYGAMMAPKVEARFAGRMWSVPSRVYSDGLAIYPGQRLPLDEIEGRLRRLGYRALNEPPAEEGAYFVDKKSLTVFLRTVDLPVLSRDAALIRFDFSGKKATSVRAIRDLRADAAVPIVELEPEELLQVFGDNHESRQLVSVNGVPKTLVDAVLAAEDADFYDHYGVDVMAVLRALYVNAKAGAVRQGGSTLTQQLAKTFFLSRNRTIMRKLKELVIALVIEWKYSKDEILEIYLNEVYLGQRGAVSVHGFGEASRFYFGQPVQQISAGQAATLAGIIRGPQRYSPHRHPEAARTRRDQVLSAMAVNGALSEDQAAAAIDRPLGTVAFSPYQRTAPYFFDYVASQLSTMYPKTELSREGLSLYTTLDFGVQEQAEQALTKGLAALEKKKKKLRREGADKELQGAIVVLEPSTGHVVAMVGGRDYGKSQFNRVTQARRQPGSAFKPFVFLSALDKFDLTVRLNNEKKVYKINGKRWRPKNYGGDYGGTVSARHALTHSLNVPTVDLAEKIGLAPVIETARKFGITTPLEPHLSMALGALEVEPIELVRAYAAFAHDGVLPHALSLRTVVNEDGKVMDRQHLKLQSVTTPIRAYMMTSVLKDVVELGTARSLQRRGIDFPVAGKTGTTNDYRDAWFVGYTPELVALVWVGFDDGTSLGMAASAVALPIWADLMRNIGWRTSKRWFRPPEGVTTTVVCGETGLIAVSGCPHPVSEVFEGDRAPTEECPVHRSSFRRLLDAIGL